MCGFLILDNTSLDVTPLSRFLPFRPLARVNVLSFLIASSSLSFYSYAFVWQVEGDDSHEVVGRGAVDERVVVKRTKCIGRVSERELRLGYRPVRQTGMRRVRRVKSVDDSMLTGEWYAAGAEGQWTAVELREEWRVGDQRLG